MMVRGSQNQSKTELAEQVESMGARLSGETGREHSHLAVTCFKNDTRKALSMLGDAVSSPHLDAAEFELAKQEIAGEHERNHTEYEYLTLENCHYNAYRDHMLGQPIRGEADNLANLTVDDLQAYRASNWFGDNMVVVGTGNINHDEFVAEVEANFNSVAKTATQTRANMDPAVYVPALMFIRDDEMYNANIGVFYSAPSIKDEDYHAFMLLKHMFGEYRIDKNAEHLNDVKKQYNSMHALIGDLPDVTMHKSHYFAYSDTGIWGNYFFGNEVFTRQMNYCGVCLPTIYSHYINDVEVVRGRNALYNHLMNHENDANELNQVIAGQILSLGRRVHRSEIAQRVSNIDGYHVKHLCNKWFYDAEPSFTNWGPVETTASVGSYKYFKVNTMSTVTNAHHSLFN